MPVVSVNESQTVDVAGNLADVFEIVYTIPGRPGSFTVTVPKNQDAVNAAVAEINELRSTVESIYGIS